LAAACLILGAFAAAPPAASAVVVHGRHGRSFGIALRRGVRPTSVRNSVAAATVAAKPALATQVSSSSNLQYHSGPVLHSSAPYLIFWAPSGESIPSSWESLMEQYFTDVAHDSGASSNVYGVNRQFTDAAGFADYRQIFNPSTQAIVDTQPYPAPDSSCGSESTCLSDAQLQAELQRLIAADNLPTDGPIGAAEPNANAPIYFVVTPSNVDICTSDGSGCASNTFCAYHSWLTDGGNNVLYAAIPTLLLNDYAKACQADGLGQTQEPNGSVADVALKYISHEDSETITDPFLSAWYNDTSGNEDGDNCNSINDDQNAFRPTSGSSPALYDQTINGHHYYLQSEWSNGDGNCEMRPADATLTARFSAPASPRTAGTWLTFDPSPSSNSKPLSSVTWDFGDNTTPQFSRSSGLTTIRHRYAGVGDYTVKLTVVDQSGNVSTTSSIISVGEQPTAVISPPSGRLLEGRPVAFSGGSSTTDPGKSITSYSWDFGDGSTGTGSSPSHVYTAAGTYLVKLTVTDSAGNSDTSTETMTVVGPTASFTTSGGQVPPGTPVSFDGTGSSRSSVTGAPIQTYAWTFGDGAGGTGSTTAHTYPVPGAYTVQLTVTDADGAFSTTSHQITVYPVPPTAAFTTTTAMPLVGQAVGFSGAPSSDSDGSIVSYTWSFGDGSTGSGEVTSHSYGSAGTYTVSLTVTDNNGLTSTSSRQLTVSDEPPTAGFTVLTARPVSGQRIGFSGAPSSDPDGSIVAYRWSFGDGTGAAGAAPTHVYARPGTYTVWLTVTDSSGLSAAVSRTVSVALRGRITRMAVRTGRAGATMLISVNSAGTLTVGHRRFHLRRAATARVPIALTAAQRRAVSSAHHLKLRIAVRFAPSAGPLAAEVASVTLRGSAIGHLAAVLDR
jgi:PKD repeat protein